MASFTSDQATGLVAILSPEVTEAVYLLKNYYTVADLGSHANNVFFHDTSIFFSVKMAWVSTSHNRQTRMVDGK